MEVEMERPLKYQSSKPNFNLQVEKTRTKLRPTWQREKTKASRELCLEKMRENFTRQKTREVRQIYGTADKMKYTKEKSLQNGRLYCDVTELRNIIRQTAKERLQLERHLVKAAEVASRSCDIDVTQYRSLQVNNQNLRQKLEQLQDADVRLGEKELELQQLKEELRGREDICADLEHQLHVTIEKQVEAEKHSLELELQLQELQPVSAECLQLRKTLETVENRYSLAKSEVISLQGKVNNLETLVKHMRDSADKRKELEKQHAEAVAELQKRQDEVRLLHHTSKAEKHRALEVIRNLESKVRELHKKCELQSVLHEELALEMTALRRTHAKQAWRSQRSRSADNPSDCSRADEDTGLYLVGSDTIFSSNKSQNLSTSLPVLDSGISPSLNTLSDAISFDSRATSPGLNTGLNRAVSPSPKVSSPSVTINAPKSTNSNSISHEIDRIMARIEQDNKILAELEKSRGTVDSPDNLEKIKAQLEDDKKQLDELPRRQNMKSSVTMKELDILMAKLEQDNKILAELDKKRATIGTRRPYSTTPPGSRSSTPLTGASSTSALPGSTAVHGTSSTYGSTLPSLPAGAPYNSSRPASRRREEDMYDDVDYIDLPHRGRCKVFISRYSYDPLKQSPNENPEAELCLNAGDYVLIFGDMDEDGFFSGELLDGRKGLVPSNFVEKLTGEDLFEFQSQVLYGNRDSDDGTGSFTYGDGELNEDTHLSKVTIEDYHRMNDYIDLEDLEELDEEITEIEREVPHPQRLILERQLNKSILIGWMPPDAPRGSVEAYHVYVDGVPKTTIRALEKTRALVEGVDCNQPHRISVRSVGPTGRHSRDAACTIVTGKEIPLAPNCVKASNITSTSAMIGWLPSNSNFQHVVAINSVEVKSMKPGFFRHLITGLAPNTTYKVSVRARPARLFINHENPRKLGMLTTTIEFRTHPKGIPDPPVDVQVEPGPQDGTLLVTWLPVTINTKGTSNGAPVTGYVVYTGDRKVGEINSPTSDHALLDMNHLAPLKKRILTVRTKSGNNLSSESMPCLIPVELLKGVATAMKQYEANAACVTNEEAGEREIKDGRERPTPRERKRSTGSSDSESDTELAELLKHVKCRSEAFNPAAENQECGPQGSRVEDLVEEGIRSELSDIAEETEEDLLTNAERGARHHHHHHHHAKETHSGRDQSRRSDKNLDRRDDYHDSRYSEHRRDDLRSDRRDDMRTDRRDDLRTDRHDDMRRSERRDVIDRRDELRDDRQDIRRVERHDDRRDYYSQDRQDLVDPMRTNKLYSRSSPEHRPHGRISPTGIHREHSPRDRGYSSRHVTESINSRRFNNLGIERRNSAGQVIIEPEENLSDKEIYPQAHHVIPAIEITRDGEAGNPDSDYARRSHRDYYDSHHRQTNSQYYQGDRSRARPVSPTPPTRHYRDQESSYYGQRGSSRREEYYGNGYRRRGSPRGTTDGRPRLFMALYDYDPQTMSPNPDAAEDELTFHEGQIIKVYGEKDADGFFRGEINGRHGYVPYNMVTEVPMDEEETAKHMLNETNSSRHHHHHHTGDSSDPWSNLPIRKLVAMYDYDPQELSPNVDAEMELAFKTGDVIYVYGGVDEDGFFMGELNGVRGLVPSNFLTEAPPDFREPKVDRLGPSTRSASSRPYPKDHHDHHDAQYVRDSHGDQAYSSSRTAKDHHHMVSEKERYTERAPDDRSRYDRSRSHAPDPERDRHHDSSSRSRQQQQQQQHW